MTTNVFSELGDKWIPLHWTQCFAPQRAPDMWFGDELPPTLQADVMSPLVQQSMWMIQHTVRQTLERGMRRQAALAEQRRFTTARSRIGKRTKTKRH